VSEGQIATPGGPLAYEIDGEGPTVTFLHPGLWDARTWDREFVRFADAGFRVLRYDARGFGRSGFPDAEFSHAADLLSVLDALKIERTALVGCSMGGGTAVEFTLAHPDRVWALALAAAGLSGFEWSEEIWEPIFAPIYAAAAEGDLVRATDLALGIWAPLGTTDPAGMRIRDIALDNARNFELDESGLELSADPPSLTRLYEIDVPALIVLGDADVNEITQLGELMASQIPGAQLVRIEGADHVVNLRRPEAFERAVLPFLQRSAP
jgi:3-oxoadipate enol-lactonase